MGKDEIWNLKTCPEETHQNELYYLDLNNSIYCDFEYMSRLLGVATIHKVMNNIKSGNLHRKMLLIICEKYFGIRILNNSFPINNIEINSNEPNKYHLVITDKEKWLWTKLKYEL